MAACLGAISLGAFAAPSGAPITLVVPYTPGTGIDLIARQLSANLPALLDQPVVVDNVPGASGNIGSEKVARAKPDGQTLLV
ncbi:MAG: tripartite tricarboxylate transporter substrate binding protein, partial [Ottowia sp.]|nr:tripartite tricarboxylate transporter substrate binding protein [Ottowia sp.]